jgi:hypothetical protein
MKTAFFRPFTVIDVATNLSLLLGTRDSRQSTAHGIEDKAVHTRGRPHHVCAHPWTAPSRLCVQILFNRSIR